MRPQVNDLLHGFRVDRVRDAEEIKGALVEMTHVATGARLCWADTPCDNKLFSIAFKTLPEDSTGVFHILEHSVLCGSEKYPVREPFVELLKSSMNTFLNAITFQDKTMYPVSSRNEKDFLNLTGVYLDAVFAPRILTDPRIFAQEGWHLEWQDGDPVYKGVVFNEMKGAMSDVDECLAEEMNALVFPDTCYGFNSGGDPRHIPDLSYEQFCRTYRRYYHPANSYIWLDGQIPLDKTLALINSYLSRFTGKPEPVVNREQVPRRAERTAEYALSADEPLEKRTQIGFSRIIGRYDDRTRLMAADILCDVLAGSNESPLKRALLEKGLAEDIVMGVNDDLLQPTLYIKVQNTDPDKYDDIVCTLRQTAEDLAEKGLDRESLTASINRAAFQARAMHEPAGLIRNIIALSSWLHGGDPMQNLVFNKSFAQLRAMVNTGAYEQLLRELLLTEDTLCVVRLLPSHSRGEELQQEEQSRARALASAMTAEQRAAQEAFLTSLVQWQATPDTAEQLASLPVLSLKEVESRVHLAPTEVSMQQGVRVLYHSLPCNGIVTMKLYFNLADRSLEELEQLSLANLLLGQLPTRNHDALQLEKAIKTLTGSLSFGILPLSWREDLSECTPTATVNMAVLRENLPEALALLAEILTGTRFDVPERLKEILLQEAENCRQETISAGNKLALHAAVSGFSAAGAVAEVLDGYTNTLWVQSFAREPEEQLPAFIALWQDIQARAFSQSRLIVSVTADAPCDISPLLSALPAGTPAPEKSAYTLTDKARTRISIPAQIGYAALVYDLNPAGFTWSGSLRAAARILTYGHLWNTVRVQGGAYGCGFSVVRSGLAQFYSFRDPTPEKTLDLFHAAADALEAFCRSDEDLDKYIIATVGETEPLIPPGAEGARADALYLSGYTARDLEQDLEQLLATRREDLLAFSRVLRSDLHAESECIVSGV